MSLDLGVGILFLMARNRADRDVVIDTIGPVWDGNETWLVLGGGGLFAAFAGGSLTATCTQGLIPGGFIQGVTLKGGVFAGGQFDWLTPYSLLVACGLVCGRNGERGPDGLRSEGAFACVLTGMGGMG